MKTVLNFGVLLFIFFTSYGQDEKIQVEKQRLRDTQDSARYVDVLNRVALLSYEEIADTTLLYASRARDIARRIDYPKGIADATNNLGVYFDVNGNPELSLRYYSDANSRYTRIDDTADIVQTLMNIALVYNSKTDEDKAVAHFQEALRLGASLRYDSILSLVIYNFILQYPQRFTRDSADLYIDSATRIGTRYHDVRLLLAIGQLRASRYLQAGQRDSAIYFLQQSLDGGLHEKLYFMSLDILEQLGDIYSSTDSVLAVRYYQQALDIVRQKGYLTYELDVTSRLLNFYTARHDRDKMLEYSSAMLDVYKRKQQLDNQSGIDYISYALKDEELQAVRLRSAYAQTVLWLETAAFLLIVAISVILWRNNGKSQRTTILLQQQFEQLTSTTAALEKTNRNYARLIRVVAHDLRNPIGAINSMIGLKVKDTAVSGKDKEWIRLIDSASKRCLLLITELLESDLEVCEGDLKKVLVDPGVLLRQTVLLLLYRANEKDQRLVIEAEGLPMVRADGEKLARVVENLVVNAIKFSAPESTIVVGAKAVEAEVILSVEDNGIGIPADMAGKLFEPFVSDVKRKGTAGEASFGLGLYICKQIVVAHGGRIWFESTPGQGTTFFISLPGEAGVARQT